MNTLIQFVKNWTLPLSIVIGVISYPIADWFTPLSPWLIFMMLLLTFSKISFKDLKLTWSHLWLAIVEFGGAVGAFYLIAPFDKIAAQAVMVCVICPTATAAAVVTGKLHGDIASISTYTLLCNLIVAIAVPALFPIIAPMETHPDFWQAFLHIMKKIFPLLICPFIIAQLIRYIFPKTNKKLTEISGLAFYMWAVALVIAMGLAIQHMIAGSYTARTFITIAIGSALAAVMQFGIGKIIGNHYNDTIAAGQSLGQKNTILAIWMCDSYLNPISTIGPGLYIIWQNIFNSWQLYCERKKGERRIV